jgi:hypothetical protein
LESWIPSKRGTQKASTYPGVDSSIGYILKRLWRMGCFGRYLVELKRFGSIDKLKGLAKY